MIRIPRSILKRFRTLCRRGGLHKSRTSGGPYVAVAGGADGYTLRAASPDVCIHFHDSVPCDAELLRLPLDALEVCEGRDDACVDVESLPGNRALLSWVDRGVPRQHEVDQPKADGFTFPDLPPTFVDNESRMWAALRDAVATTDTGSTRYALGCLHFRGKLGRFDATDGRQVLTQSGYQFGFDDDLLVPASPLVGCRDLDGESVAVGHSDEWIAFRIGKTVILVRVQKEGRFPKIDELMPAVDRASSRLELSPQDADFLLGVLPSLPSSDPQYMPITLDLNDQVLIRSRDADRARPTEVELSSSRLSGEVVMLNTDRRFFERALRLGFCTTSVYGSKSPVLCADERRRYLWALLDADSAVPRSTDAVRIESPTAARPQVSHKTRKHHSDKPSSLPSTTPPVVRGNQDKKPDEISPIEQAVRLRDALRDAAGAAHQLARSLKQRQRQQRIVASTLQTLRQLQAAG